MCGHEIVPAQDILREILAEWKLTKTAFANAIGYTQGHVSRVMAGQTSISAHFAYSVEEAYGVPALHLLNAQSMWQLHVVAESDPVDRSNPRKGNTVSIDEDRVEKDYRSGATIQELAQKNVVSYGTIWRILDKREVPTTPFGGPVEGRPVGEQRGLRPHRWSSRPWAPGRHS